MSDQRMYDILGKFQNLDPKLTPVKETAKDPVYENVEARGSITEAVKSLEEKYQGFKKTVAAIKKGGSAEDPEAVAAAIGRKKYGKKKFQKAAAAGKKLGEAAKPDYIDLDKDGDKTEPMKQAAKDVKKKAVKEGEYDPAPVDPEAVAKRKRLQALKDKAEDERAEKGDEHKSNVRTVKGKAYGGAAQKDDADDLDEVAPPGAKAERMVKHIKKGYAKDGKLTKREKGIAYATAWKAHKAGKLQESRVIQEGDYFYEKLGKALAEKNPTLNTADSSFVAAVRQEMVAQGIEPNRARNIIMMDEDFISDVASSYAHYCKEIAECGAPMNSHLGGAMEELDEIARLAGLGEKVGGNKAQSFVDDVTHTEVFDEEAVDEGNEFTKARLDAIAAGKDTFTVGGKVHKVSGDTSQEKTQVEEAINVSVQANADDADGIHILQLLSGLQAVADDQPAAPEAPAEMPLAQPAAPAEQPLAQPEVAEERDIEYTNTPDELTAPLSAAIPSGTDLNRAKVQDPETANKAANPLAKKEKDLEESLWKRYEDLISDVRD